MVTMNSKYLANESLVYSWYESFQVLNNYERYFNNYMILNQNECYLTQVIHIHIYNDGWK